MSAKVGLVHLDAPKVEISRQTHAELAIWVYRHKQEKINQNKNFKCAKAAVSWVKRHRSCWYEGQCSISWYNNVLRRTKEDPDISPEFWQIVTLKLVHYFWCVRSDFQQIHSAFWNAKWLVYIEHAFLSVFGRINFLSSKYCINLWIVLAEATSNLRILLQYLPRYTNHTALGIVWSRKSNFAVFESFILFFYQYFLPKSYLKRVVEQKANVLSSFEFIARFLKTEFCFFSTVLRNVCPFVFLQTAFAFFWKNCPFVFLWKVCHLVYSFVKYFLPKSYLKREKRVVEQKEICFRCCKKVPKCLVLPDWAKWQPSKFLTKKIQRHGWNKLRRNKVGIHARSPREKGGLQDFSPGVYIWMNAPFYK